MQRIPLLGLLILALAGCGSGANDPAPKTWKAPVPFSALHQGFQGARLVSGADGRALLAWTKDAHVWASTSADGSTWSPAAQVDDAAQRASLAGLSMSASGKAALLWHAEESTPADRFKVRRFDPATGWAASPHLLDALTTDGTGGAVDVNDAGDVMAVFTRYDASGHVWASAYAEASGWSPEATRLDTLPNYSNFPDLALDGRGDATAVWEQWDGARNRAFARRFVAGSGWDAAATELDGAGDPSIDKILVAVGPGGDGLAHWTLEDRSGVKVRRLVGGTWQAAETAAAGDAIYRSDARVAPDGRIVLTWTDGRNVHARTCLNGVWDAAEVLVSDDTETVGLRTSVMAMDRTHGRVVVMWTRLALNDADGSAVWARRYDPATGWSPVEQAVPWTPGILYDVDDVVLFEDGRALGVLAGEDVSVWEYSTFLISFR
jgi:hypothetical protein